MQKVDTDTTDTCRSIYSRRLPALEGISAIDCHKATSAFSPELPTILISALTIFVISIETADYRDSGITDVRDLGHYRRTSQFHF